MKRLLFAILSAILILSLSACGSAVETPTPDDSDPGPSESVPTVTEDNPLLAAEFLSIPRGNGKYGYVNVSRDDLPDLSSTKFSDILSEFMDRRIINYDGNYVIVDFGDGTGLHFFIGNESGLFADYCDIIDDSAGFSYGYFVRNSLDEPFTYTDFYIRKIPNPTFEQEALVPDNYFEPAPVEIFSTTAEENGLGDTAFYASGEIVSRFDVGGYDTIQVATEAGDLYISAVLVDLPEISDGEAVTVYFVYTGWSDSLGGACGAYVYSE